MKKINMFKTIFCTSYCTAPFSRNRNSLKKYIKIFVIHHCEFLTSENMAPGILVALIAHHTQKSACSDTSCAENMSVSVEQH